MAEPELLKLQQEWLALFQNRNVAEAQHKIVFDEIVKGYSSSGRHYHNLHHLQDLFRHFHEHEKQLVQADLTACAIFFHDLVYNPVRRDNESKSAVLASKKLKILGLEPAVVEQVCLFINSTKTHIPPDGASPDLHYFLDFDLAILGSGWSAYLDYTQKIRKEYMIYPDLVYIPGRRQVLKQFLNRPQLFYTPVFQQKYEIPARENLRRELSLIS